MSPTGLPESKYVWFRARSPKLSLVTASEANTRARKRPHHCRVGTRRCRAGNQQARPEVPSDSQQHRQQQKKYQRRQNEPEHVLRQRCDPRCVAVIEVQPDECEQGCQWQRCQCSSPERAALCDLGDDDDYEGREEDFEEVVEHVRHKVFRLDIPSRVLVRIKYRQYSTVTVYTNHPVAKLVGRIATDEDRVTAIAPLNSNGAARRWKTSRKQFVCAHFLIQIDISDWRFAACCSMWNFRCKADPSRRGAYHAGNK